MVSATDLMILKQKAIPQHHKRQKKYILKFLSYCIYIIHLLLDLDEVPTTDMGLIKSSKVNSKKKIDDLEIKYLTLTPNILTLTYNSKYLPGGGEDTGVEGFEP